MPDLVTMQLSSPLEKVLVFSSKGGGNRVVGKAIGKIIEERFGAEVKHPDVDKLWPDPFSTMSGGRYDAINYYDYLLKSGQMCTLNMVTSVGKLAMSMRFRGTVEKIKSLIKKEKVGLLVSATPFIGPILLKAAQERNVPVLIVSADFDNSLYSFNWPEDKNLPPYRYAIPYSCGEILETVNPLVDPDKVVCTGYPLRSEFLVDYSNNEVEHFRNEIGIHRRQKLVLLMLGSCGGKNIETYTKRITRSFQSGEIKPPMYLAVICGKNQGMPNKIAQLAKREGLNLSTKAIHPDIVSTFRNRSEGLTISTVGFTRDVYKFMAVAGKGGLMVTKPGPGSLAEGIAMAVPLLVDNVQKQIPWESMNPGMVEKYFLGRQIRNFKAVGSQINSLLTPAINHMFKEDIKKFKTQSVPRNSEEGIRVELLSEESRSSEIGCEDFSSRLLLEGRFPSSSQSSESFDVRVTQLCTSLILEKGMHGAIEESSEEESMEYKWAASCGFMTCAGK